MASVLAQAWFTMAIDCLRIHRVDGQASIQQSGDEQSMRRFDNAGEFFQSVWCFYYARA
jgi:hypothetical protein